MFSSAWDLPIDFGYQIGEVSAVHEVAVEM